MATKHFENGIVGTTEGGSTDISADIFTTGAVYFVNSSGGSDSNSGLLRSAPKATLSSALTDATASNGDIIIIEASHSETLTSSLAFSEAGITVLGLGTGSTKPSFTVNGNVDMFDITAARVRINGLRFPAGTAAHTARVNVGASNFILEDCDFTCGANDLNSVTLPDAGDYAYISGCTFTISADGPDAGLLIESATLLGLQVINCTFDGGTPNFDDGGIYSAVAHVNYLYRSNVLTNKAHIIHTTTAKGIVTGTVAGDGSRVEV